jgi:cell division septation protein DedD
MDNVLKQRLIGASILIALAVIFVPMLFDGPETDPVSRELDIDLPSAPGDRAPIRRLPLDPEQTRATGQSNRSDEDSALEAPIEAPRMRTPRLTDGDSGSNVPGTGGRDEPVPPSMPEAPPEVDASAPDLEADETGDASEGDALGQDWQAPPAPADSTTDAAPETSAEAATDAVQGFEVQVASFGNRENADALVERLTRLGHVAEIDILVRGPSELHRVRTGPYQERDDAERALSQIAQTIQGVNPVIVGSSAVPGPTTLTDSGFAVQVGSFASRDNALRLLDQLGNQGFEAFIHQDQAGSRTIWRVRVGPLGTRAEAVERLARLTEDAGIDGLVVSHP